MSLRTLITFGTLGLAAAQTSVVSLFIPNADPQPLAASVVAKHAKTTTYSINCPPGTDGNDCGMGPGVYLTDSPKTVEYKLENEINGGTNHVVCSMGGTTTGICTMVESGRGSHPPVTTTSTLDQSDLTPLPVTITAGPGVSAATTAASTTQTGSAGSTGSSEGTASPASSELSSASSSSVSSGVSTGGLPRATSMGGPALGGAVVALVGAFL